MSNSISHWKCENDMQHVKESMISHWLHCAGRIFGLCSTSIHEELRLHMWLAYDAKTQNETLKKCLYKVHLIFWVEALRCRCGMLLDHSINIQNWILSFLCTTLQYKMYVRRQRYALFILFSKVYCNEQFEKLTSECFVYSERFTL